MNVVWLMCAVVVYLALGVVAYKISDCYDDWDFALCLIFGALSLIAVLFAKGFCALKDFIDRL